MQNPGIRGIIIEKPSSTNYLYFSEKLQNEQLESRARKVVREIQEAKAIQESIDKKKSLPKRFRINNLLVDVDYSIQTKLLELSGRGCRQTPWKRSSSPAEKDSSA